MSKYFIIDSNIGIYEKSYTDLINNSIKISHRVFFNCVSVTNSFIAVGCNTGNIYLFTFENDKFKYFSNIMSNDVGIDRLMFAPSKYYLAYTNIKFQIFIYKLNQVKETSQLIRQVDSTYNCPICSLLWDDECLRLFCGFQNGAVDAVYVPQQVKDIFHIPSENIVKLDRQTVIQMDFIKETLLVSTNEKVILVNIENKFSISIGTKPRSGQYGACFWLQESKNLKIIAARPHYRLWIATSDGTVEETQQYKNLSNIHRYKIRDSGENLTETGQFHWLCPIKNNLIFAGETGGIILIIDLILKSCLITIDCGQSLSKTIYSNYGVLILLNQREIINISVVAMVDVLMGITNESIDIRYAIDLFLSLKAETEINKTVKGQFDNRKIFNSFPPHLLSLIVEKSADLNYKFVEANNLQVEITDNEEYQKLYYQAKVDDALSPRDSNSNTTEQAVESSVESSNSLSSTRSFLKKTTLKTMVKAPQLLQVFYDKTSKFFSQMDIEDSSGNELHMSSANVYSPYKDEKDKKNDSNFRGSSTKLVNEKMGAAVNLMELEADVYISWERMKQLKMTDEISSKQDFLDSLSNFCESWLLLSLRHFQNLFSTELHIRNLSATLPNFSSKSIHESISSNLSSDSFISQEELGCLYCNSWSNTINVHDWIKPLQIPDKIASMTSTLLSQCFINRSFLHFPDLIANICNITNIETSKHSTCISDQDILMPDSSNDKSNQIGNNWFVIPSRVTETKYRFPHLLTTLENDIWPVELDLEWIKSMIFLFHSEVNLKDMRKWIGSCIPHTMWITIFDSFKEIYSLRFAKTDYKSLPTKTQSELDVLLFNCLCGNSIEALILSEKIFRCMKQQEIINWKIIIESETLDLRDILHFSIKNDVDLTNYIIYLFNYINVTGRFHSRSQLIEYIYSQPDVLISFLYTLLSNQQSEDTTSQICSCGMIIAYSTLNLPDNIYNIAVEILKWGSEQNIFKNENNLLELLSKTCINLGFHQGYIELLIGMNDIKKLICMGIQLSNIGILERIKDCNISSSKSLKKVIEFIITLHRKQVVGRCLHCGQIIENYENQILLTFEQIGELVFNNFIDKVNDQDIYQSIIKMLTKDEINQIKKFLIESVRNVVNSRKVCVKNQMFSFINAELNQTEDSAKLTEMYLNIYAMNHSDLCGPNWGKILTLNMSCDICGVVFIGSLQTVTPSIGIVSFSCNHTFHKTCLEDIGCQNTCFIC